MCVYVHVVVVFCVSVGDGHGDNALLIVCFIKTSHLWFLTASHTQWMCFLTVHIFKVSHLILKLNLCQDIYEQSELWVLFVKAGLWLWSFSLFHYLNGHNCCWLNQFNTLLCSASYFHCISSDQGLLATADVMTLVIFLWMQWFKEMKNSLHSDNIIFWCWFVCSRRLNI